MQAESPRSCPDDDALAAHVEACVTGDGGDPDVQAHLDACTTCRRAVSALAGAALDEQRGPLSDDPTALAGTTPAASEATGLCPGQSLGRFTLTRPLGSGAMGEVWAARDPELARAVAIKVLRLDARAWHHDGASRLRREAQAMARLRHPNVVAIHELGSDGQQVFCAMELVEGPTLRTWLREPRPWRQVLDVLIDAGRGVAAAHAAGLVHRDIKPDNVLIGRGDGRDERAQVSDFGLARLADMAAAPAPAHAGNDVDLVGPLTRTGAVVGTPAYMPLEQLEGGEVGVRSDQFSFCVTAYEALFGARPFAGDSVVALAEAIERGPQWPARRAGVPRAVVRCLRRGLSAREPDRWPSMEALLDALAAARTRRRSLVAVVAAAVALISVALVLLWGGERDGVAGARAAAERRIATAWSEARKASLSRAFVATGHPLAEERAQRLAAVLDRYRDAWLGLRVDAWAATHVRREQSVALLERQLACLDGHADRLAALVDVLATADAAAIDRAIDAAHRLPEMQACADRERLLASAPPASSHRRDLADLEALALAGRHDAAVARAEALLAGAEASGDAPTVARAGYLLGSALANRGDLARAEEVLRRAIEDAARARDHRLVADGGTGSCSWSRSRCTITRSPAR